jgi:lysozyme
VTPADFTVRFPPPAAVAPLAGETSPNAKGKPLASEPADDYLIRARAYIKANEGVKYAPYQDSKGYWTVGVGHLMTPAEIKAMKGRRLSEQEVGDMFTRDLTEKEKLARAKLGPAYDRMPSDARIAVLDGVFRGDLSGSPKALKLLRDGKYAEAADEYLDHDEYRESVAMNRRGKPHGVAKRMERNAQAFRSAAKPPPDRRKLSQATLP